MVQSYPIRLSAWLPVLALVVVSACNRHDDAPMGKCNGDKPVVERILDVAPPNCP